MQREICVEYVRETISRLYMSFSGVGNVWEAKSITQKSVTEEKVNRRTKVDIT
jgi:hypothetical protein